MSNRRKPLPYAAAYSIDEASMENAEQARTIDKLITEQDPVQRMALIARIARQNAKIGLALKEARAARPGENGNSEP